MNRLNKVSDKVFANIHTPALAFDIERAGCYFKNTTLAIGLALYIPLPSEKAGIYNLRLVPNFTDIDFETACVTEFWDKYPDVLKTITDSPRVTWQEISCIIDELDKEFPNLMIVSDNPSFDIAHINADLQREVGVRGLSYRLNSTYRNIIDADAFLSAYDIHNPKMWVWTKKILEAHKVSVSANHDHLPENDAVYILETYLSILDIKRNDQHPFNDEMHMYAKHLSNARVNKIKAEMEDFPDPNTIAAFEKLVNELEYKVAITSLADAIFSRDSHRVTSGFVMLHLARTKYHKYDYDHKYYYENKESVIKLFNYFDVSLDGITYIDKSDLFILYELLKEYADGL